MFGQNEVLHKDHGDGKTLHVVKGSPWQTIQGEGPYAGYPAVFIRLHGCNLRCTWCDTNFSDPDDAIIPIEQLQHQVANLAQGRKLVVISGGEPLRQNIIPLCHSLFEAGFSIQIETAGTFWLKDLEKMAIIVVSPKTPTIHPMIRRYASAFKYVLDYRMEFDGFIPITATQPNTKPVKLAEPSDRDIPIYLSPLDTYDEEVNQKNRAFVAEMAIRHNCIAGLQMHKFFGVL